MAKIWQPKDNELLKSWVDAIIDEASDDLTDWETKFMANVSLAVYNNFPLSEAQERTLEKIYAERTK